MSDIFKKNIFALWFTGISGSGKTTLARGILETLKKNGDLVYHIDGDELRKLHKEPIGFTRDDRDKNISIAVDLAREYQDKNSSVVTSFISPYRQHRDLARSKLTNFIEIFVDAPLEICEERDVKGLYKKARAGKIENFTGISDVYEPPLETFLHVQTDKLTIDESLAKILKHLKSLNLIA